MIISEEATGRIKRNSFLELAVHILWEIVGEVVGEKYRLNGGESGGHSWGSRWKKTKILRYWMQLLRALLIELSRENKITLPLAYTGTYAVLHAVHIDIDFNEHKC